MHRFYVPNIANSLTLSNEESHHCVKVLRLTEGTVVEIVDGNGMLYRCEISLAHSKQCKVKIIEKINLTPHWGHKIVLAVAPTKNNERMEWMAEKCTEIGVDRITPILCQNSERRIFKTERLNKILVAAMKQSLKANLPTLNEITPFSQLIAQPFNGNRFIAYIDQSLPREQRLNLAQAYKPMQDTMIIIGPEGDFSNEEIQLAIRAGCIPVSLGQSRLRTETAAVMACAMCHTLDMNASK